MALVEVPDGTTMDGIDVQQIIDVLTGVSDHPTQLVNNTTNYTLNIRNTETAESNALRIQSADALTDYLTVNKTSVYSTVPLAVGDDDIGAHSTSAVVKTNAESFHVMSDFVYTCNGSTGDVGTARFMHFAMSGGNDILTRVIESHMVKSSGNNANQWMSLDVSVNSSVAIGTSSLGDAQNGLYCGDKGGVGINIRNLGDIWLASGTPQRMDTALLIGGDYRGWENGILYMDTAAQPNNNRATLFRVDKVGKVTAAGQFFGKVGTGASVSFAAGYVGTGIFAAAANVLGLAANGAEMMRIGTDGMLDFRNGQNVAAGGGATLTMAGMVGGSGPTTAAAAGLVRFKVGGTTVFIPYWV